MGALQCSHFGGQRASPAIMAETQMSSADSCQRLLSGETVAGLAGYSPHSDVNEVKHGPGKKLLEFNPDWTG